MKGRIYTSAQVSICQSRESASNVKKQSINGQCWMALVGFSHACLPGHRWLFRPKPSAGVLYRTVEPLFAFFSSRVARRFKTLSLFG